MQIQAFARKVGMSQIFSDQGKLIPITILEVQPGTIVRKTDNDYQVAAGAQKPKKSILGQLKKAGISTAAKIRTFNGTIDKNIGDVIDVNDFKTDDIIKIHSIGKGKGFSGVVKKHRFSRGPETHGSDHHRAPGSIGSGYPERVIKGRKMPGRHGGGATTIKNLKVIQLNSENQLLAVKGSIAGANHSWINITKIK